MSKKGLVISISLLLTLVALTWGGHLAHAGPGGGTYYANSPAGGATGTAMRKFVDSLPGLGTAAKNNLGQHIAVANADTTSFPGSDYYVIGLKDYTVKMHSDLPKATKIRGYYQINTGTVGLTDASPTYLGPVIVATKDRPVRVKFVNQLGLDASGNLFIPVDTTVMGAGTGPNEGAEVYTENRATIHLHGGLNPWISDGTPHQWITPAGQVTSYPKGMTQQNVPDMWYDEDGSLILACAGQTTCGTAGATTNPGPGAATFYFTNQQSSRLLFYHDHSMGITRLNVYVGEAAGYIIRDASEQALIGTVIPSAEVPLVIQDKSFVPQNIAVQDALWNTTTWGQYGDLWFPHVYEKNQDPNSPDGLNPLGRWDYGPWVWPPTAVANQTLPQLSIVPESFMDAMVVNGTAYPYLTVDRKAYRFRILNASNDRTLNLQLYYADASGNFDASGNYTEVKMVIPAPDVRDGGVPDQTMVGPRMLQIGTEAGFLPAPVVLNDTSGGKTLYIDYNPDSGNVSNYNLVLMPAERADVIIDFSQIPVGSDASRTLILYNDAPSAFPGGDPRYDYYTGNPDHTLSGGAPSTLAGFGPNTRTIMQFRLSGAAPAAIYDEAALNAALPAAYTAQQHPHIVPANTYANLLSTGMTVNGTFMPFKGKSINEGFDINYGRISATLGTEANAVSTPLGYADPPTEIVAANQPQLWRVTHNGVDSHPIHFHLFDVQVVNRIGFDGSIIPPDANELGWKETVRMNPLEQIIVALRPVAPSVPFSLPDSIRPLAPQLPVGVTAMEFSDPATINTLTNFGHEYAWHCHILGHEEFDLMRPTILNLNTVSNILWRDATDGRNVVWYMDGTTIAGSANLPAAAPNWTVAARGDFNSDGRTDIIWRNTTDGRNVVWYMDGTTIAGSANLPAAGLSWTVAGAGDFNGDGKPDILWRDATDGRNVVWYMNGTTIAGSANLPAVGLSWNCSGIGDFNSDGKPDIIWRNTTDGRNVVWYMNGTTIAGSANLPVDIDQNWSIVGTGDFNYDVYPDILWRHASTGQYRVWYMNGVNYLGIANLPAVGLNWKIATTY